MVVTREKRDKIIITVETKHNRLNQIRLERGEQTETRITAKKPLANERITVTKTDQMSKSKNGKH